MFKEQDDKGITPYDLGYFVGKEKDDSFNPYDEDTDAWSEYADGFYNAQDNDNDDWEL